MHKKNSALKMYVLVRKDLDTTYRSVQGGHAISEYSVLGDQELYRKWFTYYKTMVFLGIPNERVMEMWTQRLTRHNKNWVGFREPDLKDQLTAVACVDTGEVFKHLRLA